MAKRLAHMTWGQRWGLALCHSSNFSWSRFKLFSSSDPNLSVWKVYSRGNWADRVLVSSVAHILWPVEEVLNTFTNWSTSRSRLQTDEGVASSVGVCSCDCASLIDQNRTTPHQCQPLISNSTHFTEIVKICFNISCQSLVYCSANVRIFSIRLLLFFFFHSLSVRRKMFQHHTKGKHTTIKYY